jgi:hypothetical protein
MDVFHGLNLTTCYGKLVALGHTSWICIDKSQGKRRKK